MSEYVVPCDALKEVVQLIETYRKQCSRKAKEAYETGAGFDVEAFADGQSDGCRFALHHLENLLMKAGYRTELV
jgi:hypothetical protein